MRVGPFAPLSGATLLRTIAGRRTSARECVRQLRLIKEKFFLLLLPPSSPFSRGAIRVPRREKKSCPAPLFFASVSASRHSSVAQIRPKKECSKNNILLPTTDPAADRTFLPPPPHNECASEEGSEPPYLAAFSKVRGGGTVNYSLTQVLHHLPLYSFPLPFSLTLPSFHRRHPIPLPPSPSPYSPVPPNTQLPFQTSSGGEGRGGGGGGEGRKERYWTFPIKRDQFPRRRHPDPTSPLSPLSPPPLFPCLII